MINITTNVYGDCESCEIVAMLASYYSMFLIVLATFGNAFSSYVCFRKELQKVSTFRIYSLVFIFAGLAMYTWILDIFLQLFQPKKYFKLHNIDDINVVESYSVPTCKIFTFLQYFSLQCSAWLLTYSSIDQILKLYFPSIKYNRNKKYVYKICIFIVVVFGLLNCHILLFAGKVLHVYTDTLTHKTLNLSLIQMDTNISYTINNHLVCFDSDVYSFWPLLDQIHLFVYSLIPYCVMINCNFLLIRKIFHFRPKTTTNTTLSGLKKKRQLSLIIVFISCLFITCTSPSIVLYGYFFAQLSSTPVGFLMLPISDLIHLSFIGYHFIIQFLINKIFRTEFLFALHQARNNCWIIGIKSLLLLKLISFDKYVKARDLHSIKNTKNFFTQKTEKNGSLTLKNNKIESPSFLPSWRMNMRV